MCWKIKKKEEIPMSDTKQYPIPGETEVRDNNWKEVVKELAIQPRTMVEKTDWKVDAVALATSPNEFVERANTWPSALRDNRNQYYPTSGAEKDFFGPLAYCGVRSPFAHGIKIPQLSGEKEAEDFALYTRMIHKYYTNVDQSTMKYSNQAAHTKATMNAALLIATVESRFGRDLGLKYTQSDNTSMSEICGLIGKKIDGSDMTEQEQALFLSNLADNYVGQLRGNARQTAIISGDKTYGEYKKEVDGKKSKEIDEQIAKMSPEEQRAMLSKLLSQRG